MDHPADPGPDTGTAKPVDNCMESHPMITKPDFILESIGMGLNSGSALVYRGILLSLVVKHAGDFPYKFDGPCMNETELKVRFDYDSNYN